MIKGYFGLPGCGKSTFLTMIAQKTLRKISKGKSPYKRVFTNYYCDGCYQINYKNLGLFDYSDSLILLDEITLDADSRNFKQFDEIKKQFFLLHRHYNIDVIYFTQQWDGVDKKIRDITQDLYYVRSLRLPILRHFSFAKRIFRTLDINDYDKQLVNGYRKAQWFDMLVGKTTEFCFRPLWYKYFDSFEVLPLVPPILSRWSSTADAGAPAEVE